MDTPTTLTSTTLLILGYLWAWLSVWAAILAGAQQSTPITLRLTLTTLATTSAWPLFPLLYAASHFLSPRPRPDTSSTTTSKPTVANRVTPPPVITFEALPAAPEAWEDIPAFLRRPSAAA